MNKELEQTTTDAANAFRQAVGRIRHAFDTTADDRLDWSPSPSARSPLQIMAHAAWAIGGMHGMLEGNTLKTLDPKQADVEFREWESQFQTKDQVLDYFEEKSSAYLSWLDALTLERLLGNVELPFGMGQAPMTAALGFMADHLNWHAAQIAYVQTIYGDRDWHM